MKLHSKLKIYDIMGGGDNNFHLPCVFNHFKKEFIESEKINNIDFKNWKNN